MSDSPFGAPPDAWDQFSFVLDLTEDLLPVVSNPTAVISPRSKMSSTGKTPSLYTSSREVAGITNWTSHKTTVDEVSRWRNEPDYGICVQTRHVRAIDVDIPDPVLAAQIGEIIAYRLGALPTRSRSNSSKFLVAITLPGDYYKRVIKVAGGIIEFLATGQQFVAVGTHPSGVRYEWTDGLPDAIPTITPEKFELLWREIEEKFGTTPSIDSKAPTKALKLAQAAQNDPVSAKLFEMGSVLATYKDGHIDVVCPFSDSHTTTTADSSTSYYPRNTGGYANGHWSCLHANCDHRTDNDFNAKIGVGLIDEFDIVPTVQPGESAQSGDDHPQTENAPPKRYAFAQAGEFAAAVSARYIIKGVLPDAELAVIYGASASGKTFAVLDIAAAVATPGNRWRNLRTHHGRVAYVVAEGANFFKGRLIAYARHHNIPLSDIDLHILGAAPNLLSKLDTTDLLDSLMALGPLKLIVIDTLAQTMPGGDENTGVDVGKVLAHCKALHKHTGATVLLVHHSGKDETKGARGWSGLRAACDAELEVTRNDNLRTLRVSKQKDAKDGIEFGFKLQTVVIGTDEDDDPIESCVVVHSDVIPVGKQRRRLKGELEKLMFRLVCEMISPGGADLTPGKVIDEAVRQMPFDENGKARDQRRSHALRALDSIKTAGYIVVDDGVIKLPNKEEDE